MSDSAEPVAGFHAPVHRSLTEPILLGGAPRAVAIAQRHAGGRDRARPAPLDRRSRVLGGRPRRRGLGGQARCAVRRRGAPSSALPRPSRLVRRQAMMNLAEYRKRPALLADYLPWAALVAHGVVLNKDGSFQRTARFRGPDLDTATPAELVGTTARLNNALRRLGSGWAIFVEAQRDAANRYPRKPLSRCRLGPGRCRAQGAVRGGRRAFRERVLPDPRAGCRRRKTPLAPKRGSTKAAPRAASTPARCCAASSTAPTACCSSSRASCPMPPGSMTPRR